jgi:hypothetical protein
MSRSLIQYYIYIIATGMRTLHDKNLPAMVAAALGWGECLKNLPVENGTVVKLAEVFLELTTVGTVVLVSSVSHLAAMGTWLEWGEPSG